MICRLRVLPLTAFLALCLTAASACSAAAPGGAAARKGGGSKEAVAVVDGQTITQSQLDERAARSLYDIRKQALDDLINEQLLEKEAKAQGVTREELLQREVSAKVTQPSQAEIDQVWEANKGRVGDRTKEQMTPDIVNWLKNQKSPALRQSYLQSLRTKYKVQVLLEPPRVQVAADDDPAKGPANAPVTIVEFSDFQCPYCSRVEGTLQQVMEKYKDKVRFVYRDFPLPMHAQAPKAAEAAQCAHEQEKFWEYHDALYGDQSKLAVADLQATAARLGLDAEKFKTCLESGKFTQEVSKDMADAQKAGVNSTPSFFINGIPVVGAQGYEAFADIIDRELARAGK